MKKLNLNPLGLSACDYDPIAHAKMRADTVNASQGELTGFDCKKCKNRGFFAYFHEDGTLFTRACSCMQTRRCIREMERSGLQKSIRELTFEAFQTKTPWQEKLKKGAQDYAQTGTGWFLAGGQAGCGKTHLCTAICRQRLLDGHEVLYMSWREQVSTLKSLAMDPDRRTERLERFKRAQILYIDDLYKCGLRADGGDLPSSAEINLAFEIINYRYQNRLPTIISTERSPQELVRIDEATGSRIIELAGDHVYSIAKDPGKNYRMRGVVNL